MTLEFYNVCQFIVTTHVTKIDKIQFDETKYGSQRTQTNQNAIRPTRLSANFSVSPVQKWPCSNPGRLTVQVLRSHTVRHVILSRAHLDEESAFHRHLYVNNAQHSQDTDIRSPNRIRTRDPS